MEISKHKDVRENIEKSKKFLLSKQQQEAFVNEKGNYILVTKTKEEPKFNTYWFKLSNDKYGRMAVFKDIKDMDTLSIDLAYAIHRM